MTYASKSDLSIASKKTRGIVVCPRANASLAEGIPNIVQMMEMNCNIAIGTDNVMINSPDLFREMDFLWKVTMGVHQKRIEPKNILKMVTINAEKIAIENGEEFETAYLLPHANRIYLPNSRNSQGN